MTYMAYEVVELLDGSHVALSFFRKIVRQIEMNIATLESQELYGASTLCGEFFWQRMNPHRQRVARLCVDTIVLDGVFPLEFSGIDDMYVLLSHPDDRERIKHG
jgi:hypothetical protein